MMAYRWGRSPTLAVCGVDFGWGSAGKLRAILGECVKTIPDLRVVMLGTSLGRPILGGLRVEAWHEHWPAEPTELGALMSRYGVNAGLVVLDPVAADAFERSGCPTTYVDSIPYMWVPTDPIPRGATVYCAQRCPELPALAQEALSPVQNLLWVDGICTVADQLSAKQSHLAIINLGGLHSPGVESNQAYVRLVLPVAVQALRARGFTRIEVCGNVDAGALPDPLISGCTVGPREHSEFLALLDEAGIVMSSPGLTTLLEASRRNKPVVCLPPQNLSQVLNADRFAKAVASRAVVGWPECVLDLDAVNKARVGGEHAALAVIHGAIDRAAEASTGKIATLGPHIEEALDFATGHETWTGLATECGTNGAAQVAAVVCASLLGRREFCYDPIVT